MRRDTLTSGSTIGEFAARGAVTVRTVRYYDQVGLLQSKTCWERRHFRLRSSPYPQKYPH